MLTGQGVDDFKVDLKGQEVAVASTLSSEELLTVIKKTGKSTSYVGEKN